MSEGRAVRRLFTIDEARDALPQVLALAAEVVDLRRSIVETTQRQRAGENVNIADVKANEARLSEILDSFVTSGYEVKGFAPLLLDFPSLLEGREVLLCWLEGETALEWYHDAELGFAGRRRLDV